MSILVQNFVTCTDNNLKTILFGELLNSSFRALVLISQRATSDLTEKMLLLNSDYYFEKYIDPGTQDYRTNILRGTNIDFKAWVSIS